MLSTLGLANPVCERLVNKYLEDGRARFPLFPRPMELSAHEHVFALSGGAGLAESGGGGGHFPVSSAERSVHRAVHSISNSRSHPAGIALLHLDADAARLPHPHGRRVPRRSPRNGEHFSQNGQFRGRSGRFRGENRVQTDISSVSFRSREFRAIKLLILAVAELRTRYPDSVLQFLACSPTDSAQAKQTETPRNGEENRGETQNESYNEPHNEPHNESSLSTHNEQLASVSASVASQVASQVEASQGGAKEDPGLNEAEAKQALRHWRQLHLVVGASRGDESEGTAISRLTGEEDVHDITDVNDIKREVEQFQPMEANFTGSLGSRRAERGLFLVTEHARRKQEEARMQTVWEESVQSVWREDLWFKAVKSGTEADLENMEKLLGKDPNAFYHEWDPRKLINCGRRGAEL